MDIVDKIIGTIIEPLLTDLNLTTIIKKICNICNHLNIPKNKQLMSVTIIKNNIEKQQ